MTEAPLQTQRGFFAWVPGISVAGDGLRAVPQYDPPKPLHPCESAPTMAPLSKGAAHKLLCNLWAGDSGGRSVRVRRNLSANPWLVLRIPPTSLSLGHLPLTREAWGAVLTFGAVAFWAYKKTTRGDGWSSYPTPARGAGSRWKKAMFCSEFLQNPTQVLYQRSEISTIFGK